MRAVHGRQCDEWLKAVQASAIFLRGPRPLRFYVAQDHSDSMVLYSAGFTQLFWGVRVSPHLGTLRLAVCIVRAAIWLAFRFLRRSA